MLNRIFFTRFLSLVWLSAFLAAGGLQVYRDIHPVSKKAASAGVIELAALLPSHSPATEAAVKVLKSVSDYYFPEISWKLRPAMQSVLQGFGFFPAAKQQTVRLLKASIPINAP